MTKHTTLIPILGAAVLSLGATAGAHAAATPTSLTVGAVTTLKAGDVSPFDVAGVKAIRRGKKIPAGFVLPGLKVTRESGNRGVGAALRLVCPDGKRLQSFAQTGHGGSSSANGGDYVGKRTLFVSAFPAQATGSAVTIYAVCR